MTQKGNKYKKFIRRHVKQIIAWGCVLLLSLVTYLVPHSPEYLYISMTQTLQSDPFNGTTIPIREVPDYNKISYNDAKNLLKNQIPPDKFTALPIYDPTDMTQPWNLLASLSNGMDLLQRKTVYTVLYLGDYTMSYLENIAGHPGVDIIVPVGTETYAIANGVVTIAKQTSSAGKHIVLRHDNVPSLANENQLTTYYSVYEHLSEILVNEGSKVSKGQMIGLTGNTGNSTAPHLHFQIDNDQAPWHPYWPSNFNDPTDSGSKTIHPFKWVYKYEDSDIGGSSNDPDDSNQNSDNTDQNQNNDNGNDQNSGDTQDDTSDDTNTVPPADTTETNAAALRIAGDSQAIVNSSISIVVDALDSTGQRLSDFVPSQNIELSSTIAGDFSRRALKPSDFSSGRARLSFTPSEKGDGKLKAEMGTAGGEFDLSVTDAVGSINSFLVEFSTSKLEVGVPVAVRITALGDNSQPTTSANFPGSITLSAATAGTFQPSTLSSSDFNNGVTQVLYTPTASGRTKVKVQAGALVGETQLASIDETTQLFPDVYSTHPNYQAINYLKAQGIIQGYGDGTFQPDRSVSRAEIIKIILLAGKYSIDNGLLANFPDVSRDAWYSPYIRAARDKGIVGGYPDGTFQPDKTVNKAEALKIILETFDKDTPTPTTNPYPDAPVAEWFAKYAAYAKDHLLIDGNMFDPIHNMTRADVAEVIYRILR